MLARVENSFVNSCNECHCFKTSGILTLYQHFAKSYLKSLQRCPVSLSANFSSLLLQPSLFRIFEMLLNMIMLSVSFSNHEFKESLMMFFSSFSYSFFESKFFNPMPRHRNSPLFLSIFERTQPKYGSFSNFLHSIVSGKFLACFNEYIDVAISTDSP